MTLPGSPSLLAQFRRLCLLALCTALLAACGQPKPSFKNVDISGATEFGKDFSLLDPSGKTRTLADFKGKAVVMFFGYTHCPDVCPTTMSDIAIAKSKLSASQQAALKVVFITTDPARDSPARLGEWLAAMDKTFIGLTGDFTTIQAGARSIGVDVEKPVKEKDGSITSTHGAQVIAYSPKDDKAHVLYMSGTTSDQFLADLPKIIKGETP